MINVFKTLNLALDNPLNFVFKEFIGIAFYKRPLNIRN